MSLLSPDDFPQQRTGFTDFHLWVAPHSPKERYAAGMYPNQSRGGDGPAALDPCQPWHREGRHRPLVRTRIPPCCAGRGLARNADIVAPIRAAAFGLFPRNQNVFKTLAKGFSFDLQRFETDCGEEGT